jgi:hypothetical protein
MRTVKCEKCGQERGMNDTVRVFEQTLCRECGEEALAGRKDLPADAVEAHVDPTVCYHCGEDNGNEPLETLATLPTCRQCADTFRNRPYPPWVKGFFAALAVVVIVALVWNMRFAAAYWQLRGLGKVMEGGDIQKGAAMMASISDKVPESPFFADLASYFKGAALMDENKPQEALAAFESCGSSLPAEYKVGQQITSAKIAIAFDKGEYDRFLELAMKLHSEEPSHPMHLGQVGSAYACKYAQAGNEEFKQKAFEYVEKAKQEPVEGFDVAEYEQRIMHRLETREIIDRDEFLKRFPDGYRSIAKE